MGEQYSADAVLRLFKAIITQAFEDAVSPDRTIRYREPKKLKSETDESYAKRCEAHKVTMYDMANADRRNARKWLLYDNEDFTTLVTLAGYDPDDIRQKARKLQRAGWVTEQPIAA